MKRRGRRAERAGRGEGEDVSSWMGSMKGSGERRSDISTDEFGGVPYLRRCSSGTESTYLRLREQPVADAFSMTRVDVLMS